jgi:hypothetical protein
MELLGERPAWSMSGGELLSTLDLLDAELARLETYRLHLIARLDEIGYAQEIGAHNTAQLLEFRHRLDRTRARRDVRLAQSMPKYAAVLAALPNPHQPPDVVDPAAPSDSADSKVADVDGADAGAASSEAADSEAADDDAPDAVEVWLRPAQAEAIVSALDRVPTTVPVEDLAVAERELVGLARHLSPAELRRAGQRVRDVLDTDGPEPEEQKAYGRESLTLSVADRGVSFHGYLANENAELLRAIIHVGARPHKTITGDLDPRSREKRQADALTTALTLAATALDTDTPAHRRPRPASPLVPPDADNAAAAGPADRKDRAAWGDRGGSDDREDRALDVPGFGAKANITVTIDLQDLIAATADAIGDTVYGDGLSAAAIRRLACDARVIPVVLGSNSEPLDVGRAERFVTRAMRRALNTRDKGCVICGAPPAQCDAHHLESWIDGGETKVTNLVLLCRRHHLDLHSGDWTITITDGVVHVARPTWADPPPRGRMRPQQPQTPAHKHRAPGSSTPADISQSGRQVLQRLVPTSRHDLNRATTLRDAACLAIWGELPPKPPNQQERAAQSTTPFDPWTEPVPDPPTATLTPDRSP